MRILYILILNLCLQVFVCLLNISWNCFWRFTIFVYKSRILPQIVFKNYFEIAHDISFLIFIFHIANIIIAVTQFNSTYTMTCVCVCVWHTHTHTNTYTHIYGNEWALVVRVAVAGTGRKAPLATTALRSTSGPRHTTIPDQRKYTHTHTHTHTHSWNASLLLGMFVYLWARLYNLGNHKTLIYYIFVLISFEWNLLDWAGILYL